MSESLIIVGAGHAAGQLIASLVSKGYEGQITLVGEEPYPPYQRPPLSKKFLQGELPRERLFLKPEAFYQDNGVTMLTGQPVTAIDTDNKRLQLANGDHLNWDKLVLATGSRIRRLQTDGADHPGVMYLRDIRHVDAIRERFTANRHVAIVGGGYVGLEVAAVAISSGLKVTVIEREDRLLSRVASPDLSAFYADVHQQAGTTILTGADVKGFHDSGDGLHIELDGAENISADFAVVGIGVSAESGLAESADIECDNGIVVDEFCRTSHPDVLAIGDCTNHPNALLGKRLRLESVPNALSQARTAAATLCGDLSTPYAEIPWFWSDQFDLKLQMVGLTSGYDQTVLRGDMQERRFACFYLRGGQLIAVDAVNSPREFMMSKAAIAAGARIPPEVLADPEETLKDAANRWPAE